MVGLVEFLSTADELALIDGGGIREFPSDRGLRGRTGAGHLDEGVLGGRSEIARNDEIRRQVTHSWGRGGVGGHIPTHFVKAGIFRGGVGLIGALAVNVDEAAGDGIGQRSRGGRRHRQGQSQSDIAAGVGRPGVVHGGDLVAAAQVRAVHHHVIAHLRCQPDGAIHDDRLIGLMTAAGHLAGGTDHDAVSQAGVTLGRGAVAPGVLRRHRRRCGHSHRDFLVEMLLEQPRGRHGVARQHVFPHDLRGHHGNQRDGQKQHARDGQRHQYFHEGKPPPPPHPERRLDRIRDHRQRTNRPRRNRGEPADRWLSPANCEALECKSNMKNEGGEESPQAGAGFIH